MAKLCNMYSRFFVHALMYKCNKVQYLPLFIVSKLEAFNQFFAFIHLLCGEPTLHFYGKLQVYAFPLVFLEDWPRVKFTRDCMYSQSYFSASSSNAF